MTRNTFKNSYRSNYRGKVTVEDAQKHQKYIDDMKKEDHLESSIIPHSMLHKIIQKLKTKQNDSLTLPEKAYLLRNNLNALYALVEGKISFNQYKKESSNDRVVYKKRLEEEQIRLEKLKELERIEEQKRQEKLAQERKAREQAERERRKKLESDPKYIAQQREKALLNKYEIYPYLIGNKQRSKLLNILNLLDNQQRLQEQEKCVIIIYRNQCCSF
ncbi:hypothetical protein [Acinetobacter baumannii]|uniref:hypothetical protein n=1 Tax=Acinetobacter baumannii TaxID=470 RepID=UPI003D2FDA7C